MTAYDEARRTFRVEVPDTYNFGHDVIDRWAEDPEKLALRWVGPSGEERDLTFAALREGADRLASGLRALGAGQGDRVIIVLPRVPEWQVAMIGLLRGGYVALPGTTQLQPKDLEYRARAADAAAIICDAATAEKVDAIGDGLPGLRHRVVWGEPRDGWNAWEDVLAGGDAGPPRPDTRADDAALIFFTSGTTAHPKMVLHDHRYPAAHEVTGRYWLDLRPDDLHWNASDTGWAKAAWSSLFGPWNMGAAVFVQQPPPGPFDPAQMLELLGRQPVTTLCAAPTIYRMLVQEDLGAHSFASLRRCVAAGEPLNPEVLEVWKRHTGLEIADGFGQTETVLLTGNFPGEQIRPGSMGKPSPGYEVEVIDEDLEPVGLGEEGTVAVRVRPEKPAGIMREYWRDPEANAKSFRGDWYLTGDKATRDPDGYLWFVGRSDDLINSGAYRIGPFEVESALLEHPAVAESAVVGAPDPVRGQVVKAFVVLARGHEPSDALARELQDHVKATTAPYKYPRVVEFVPELPKTISGKIRRVDLRGRA
jgi:acetyl-CoA synthetase/medium-chain acyl-CoA synthetase